MGSLSRQVSDRMLVEHWVSAGQGNPILKEVAMGMLHGGIVVRMVC